MQVGAGTFHPASFMRAIGPEPWRAAYVQPSRRPTDGRYGENPNRLQHYYQLQVILKPAPADSQDLDFNGGSGNNRIAYGQVFQRAEREFSAYNFEFANTEKLFAHFGDAEAEC